ncbi:MAG: co-chaperone GroES family protein [Melioribacteraceae bacterium]|nr:co-chaperone GroES family protein [Melioribacteraceae bacterium]MCF8262947.1 co-chaperone GroES family protein [Melioribacteraceae bacterium]MCF8414352.1 co-chaperone GroES family protein [Melioribacteraceae bacterium]MCF8430620.1 co-chaperone GroES family protein [Melioribacteraceae bacterium]
MINTQKIIVVGDRILIKPEENLDKTNSGLYLPPNVKEKETVRGGYVIKTGPGYAVGTTPDEDEPWKESEPAKYIPLQAKEGDFALYLRKDAIDIELENQKMVIVAQSAILLLLRDEDLLT